jgi:1-acyl-sn-glycerol-3-phosphate acyltransferase
MSLLENYKKEKLEQIKEEQKENIRNINDLTAGDEPSLLFYILAEKLGYLLSNDPSKCLSEDSISLRRKINKIIKLVGPKFLSAPQVFEDRNELMGDGTKYEDVVLSSEPVIWIANHAFKDDTLASILAAKRNAYILFGSLPQFFNTIDGVLSWANGVVMTNRKVSSSKHASVDKAVKAINMGIDLMMFPEGVWNKTPEKLMLELWPGIYRICKETKAKVVPMAHYVKDCASLESSNIIHTVVDNPVRIDDLSEKAALEYLRDIVSTWYYLMMEKYGKSTREEELKGFENASLAWEDALSRRVKTAARYDKEIELCADYRPKDERIDEIWENIANVKNITKENILLVEEAKQKIMKFKENDFQRRY